VAKRGRPAIPEELKHTEIVKVKLRPEDARRFRALAHSRGQLPTVLLRELAIALIERESVANR
jgi:hypothetical protein